MTSKTKPQTFAEFTGAAQLVARHIASKLARSSETKFGPGKITLAEAAGLTVNNGALSLVEDGDVGSNVGSGSGELSMTESLKAIAAATRQRTSQQANR